MTNDVTICSLRYPWISKRKANENRSSNTISLKKKKIYIKARSKQHLLKYGYWTLPSIAHIFVMGVNAWPASLEKMEYNESWRGSLASQLSRSYGCIRAFDVPRAELLIKYAQTRRRAAAMKKDRKKKKILKGGRGRRRWMSRIISLPFYTRRPV